MGHLCLLYKPQLLGPVQQDMSHPHQPGLFNELLGGSTRPPIRRKGEHLWMLLQANSVAQVLEYLEVNTHQLLHHQARATRVDVLLCKITRNSYVDARTNPFYYFVSSSI